MSRRTVGCILIGLGIALIGFGVGMVLHNLSVEQASGKNAQAAMEQLLTQMEQQTVLPEESQPELFPTPVFPEMENDQAMPEIELDGRGYVGYLELSTLELTLPVLSVSSDENLEIAPCRYFGTAYQKNFVIGGHRYRRHFRNLYTLGYGDTVIFTDVTGKQFVYQVVELEELQPYDSEYLCTGDWDLSLFTCTPGGTARVAVRCLKEDKR
jgi:sortase A